jgi:hypothetical protein
MLLRIESKYVIEGLGLFFCFEYIYVVNTNLFRDGFVWAFMLLSIVMDLKLPCQCSKSVM